MRAVWNEGADNRRTEPVVDISRSVYDMLCWKVQGKMFTMKEAMDELIGRPSVSSTLDRFIFDRKFFVFKIYMHRVRFRERLN
jgi:hypothetical protein